MCCLFPKNKDIIVPRAKLKDLDGFLTTSHVASAFSLSPYLIKARIEDGTLPPASKISESGVLLFDDTWMSQAREVLTSAIPRKRRRTAPPTSHVPTPESFFGHSIGEPRWLPEWKEVIGYFEALAAASDRVETEVLGTSTEGRPYLVVAVSAPENLRPEAREHNRVALGGLWDPRSTNVRDVSRSLGDARTVGVILATQHSKEVGAMLMTMQLAYDLASSDDPATMQILTNTIALLIPSHNPDGAQMMTDWYRRWLGTLYEGVETPWLYHPYVGHDNNRDWFMLTQQETRLYVELHNREHPQAVFDMHQMGRFGPRFMVPPFIDPLDPNQDPLIQQGFAALGSHIAQRLTAAGKPGVVTNAIFDNYSPSLAYGNYHGSVDLLSEAASAKLATSVTLDEEDLNDEYGIDPTRRSWNQPSVWKGGTWSISDIVSYDLIAARALLDHLARYRDQWLEDYATLARRAGQRIEKPYGFVIPNDQRDPRATSELLSILQMGLVEIHEATSELVADGITFPAGTSVIRLDQPAGPFAKTLLEIQDYPDLRKWPDGPALEPYDISGHTLPVQMGVHAIQIDQPFPEAAPLRLIAAPFQVTGRATASANEPDAWVIDARSNAVAAAIPRFLDQGVPVYRAKTPVADQAVRVGDVIVPFNAITDVLLRTTVEETGASARTAVIPAELAVWKQANIRLGVYQPWTGSIDEGWARWVLEEYGVPYETLRTADIRQGGLRNRVDVMLIPDMSTTDILQGRPEKTRECDPYPPEYVGGLGDAGMVSLRRFVAEGGQLIAIDHACEAIVEEFGLPIDNPLRNATPAEFSCPGSLLRVIMDSTHPLALGMPRESAVLFMNSTVFSSSEREVTIVGRYPRTNPRLSGWINGSERIEGKSALVEIEYGDGRVVLIGFRPYFRAQTRGTYRVLFNAIYRSGLAETTWQS
jgi:hypothetical protein